MISFDVAPISLAICSRAFSTACSASQPKEWLRLAALPNFVGEVRHHRLQHARIERRGRMVVHVDRQMHACRQRLRRLVTDHYTVHCSYRCPSYSLIVLKCSRLRL